MIRIVMSCDDVIEIESIGKHKQKIQITNDNGMLCNRLIN